MGLLDDLKKEAKDVSSHSRSQTTSAQEVARMVELKMNQIFLYLNELGKQLNVIKPELPRSFDVDTSLRFDNLRACEFFVDPRKKRMYDRDHYDSISLSFKYFKPEKLKLQKEFHQVEGFRQLLMRSGVTYQLTEIRNPRGQIQFGSFEIVPEIKCFLFIQAKHETSEIFFRAKNVERLGEFEETLPARDLNEGLLDELAKCLLGRANTFHTTLGTNSTILRTGPVNQKTW